MGQAVGDNPLRRERPAGRGLTTTAFFARDFGEKLVMGLPISSIRFSVFALVNPLSFGNACVYQ